MQFADGFSPPSSIIVTICHCCWRSLIIHCRDRLFSMEELRASAEAEEQRNVLHIPSVLTQTARSSREQQSSSPRSDTTGHTQPLGLKAHQHRSRLLQMMMTQSDEMWPTLKPFHPVYHSSLIVIIHYSLYYRCCQTEEEKRKIRKQASTTENDQPTNAKSIDPDRV